MSKSVVLVFQVNGNAMALIKLLSCISVGPCSVIIKQWEDRTTPTLMLRSIQLSAHTVSMSVVLPLQLNHNAVALIKLFSSCGSMKGNKIIIHSGGLFNSDVRAAKYPSSTHTHKSWFTEK